jgi:ketosteroid isomerase-like protein
MEGSGGTDATGAVDATKPIDAQMVLALGEAFRQGQLHVLQGAFTPDVVLEVAGTSRLSGTYRGSGQVIALIARALNWVDASSLSIDQVTEGEGVMLSYRIDLRHLGVKHGYAQMFQVMQFSNDGRIRHIRLWAQDQTALDRYVDQSDVV